jgi:coenzyme PQQ precursor peptide PqqA
MIWEKPIYTDIDMSAEIGTYPDEFSDERRGGEPPGLVADAIRRPTTGPLV